MLLQASALEQREVMLKEHLQISTSATGDDCLLSFLFKELLSATYLQRDGLYIKKHKMMHYNLKNQELGRYN